MINQTILLVFAGIVGVFGTFIILKYPYLGIAITGASLAIVDLLPPIPYLSSAVPLVGLVSVVGYLLAKRKGPRGPVFSFSPLHTIALLFILWVFISNPQAAVLGDGRNWVLTFAQLWVLLYMAGDLLDTPQKQKMVMAVFSVFAILSAFYAIQSGGIGETFDTSIRAEGFVDNSNAAARYFVVAMVFLSYLRTASKNPVLRFFSLVGILVTYFGVIFTLSRTGMVLLFAAQGLILFFQLEGRQRMGLIALFLVALIGLWFLSESIFDLMGTILPTVTSGEDTMGLRYNLWRAGFAMWLDHPIRGVGIGRYIEELGPYMISLEGPRRWSAVAHNTYVHILTETGIVGFALFMSMIIITLKNYLKAGGKSDKAILSLRNTWLIAFLVMLLGGMTKSDHVDKLTWMVMGLSVYFAGQSQTQEVPEKTHIPSKPETMQRTSYPS
jgi:O-antigen ligase